MNLDARAVDAFEHARAHDAGGEAPARAPGPT